MKNEQDNENCTIDTGNIPKGKRYQFTREDCSRGYWAAVESISRRHFPLLEGKGETLARRFLFARMK